MRSSKSNTNLNQQAFEECSKKEKRKSNKKKLKIVWVVFKSAIRIGFFLWKVLEFFTNDT